jgi:ribose/xylose/arabinose/galactoside ABC-type transport system permease subunit
LQSENQLKQDKSDTRAGKLINFQQWGVIFVLIALIIIMGISSPVFLSARNIKNILQQISTLGIVSLGMTILMISGGIDLSVGSTISVIACVVSKMLKAGVPVWISIITGLALGCIIGLLNGSLAAYTRAAPFILTLGTMTFLQGIALLITKGFPITNLGKTFEYLGSGVIGRIPFIVILFFVLLFIAFFFLKYFRLGRTAYAIGGNEQTAYLAGIPVRRNKLIFYMLCGFLAGLAAMVLAARVSSAQAGMGTGFELRSIGAVVIGGTPLSGGTGNVFGTLTGVLLLGIIANGLNLLHVDPAWQYIVTGGVIVFAVILHEHLSK